jgi:SCY1-like protein 1
LLLARAVPPPVPRAAAAVGAVTPTGAPLGMLSWLKGATSSLPFKLGAQVEGFSGSHPCWTSLCEATLSEDGSAVSVFVCEAAAGDPRLELAKHAAQCVKRLRHPTVLGAIKDHETSSAVYVVTEPVVPLEVALAAFSGAAERTEAVAWGLSQLADAMAFLSTAGKIHGCLNPSAVFVTKGGDWRLGGFELLGSADEVDSHLRVHSSLYPPLYMAPEMRQGDWSDVRPGVTDAWSLGCVTFRCFNDSFSEIGEVKRTERLPPQLVTALRKLVQRTPGRRLTASQFRDCEFFSDSATVAVCSFVEPSTILMKSAEERAEFLESLSSAKLSRLPSACRVHKLLPALEQAVEHSVRQQGSTACHAMPATAPPVR